MQQYQFQDLSHLFNPRSIAVVGASDRPNSIGAHALANIAEHSAFDGELYLVNPKKDEIDGRKCYPSVAALPEAVDVALIVIPAAGVVEAVEQAGAKGIPFAVILTSGFSEADVEGRAAEEKLKEISARTGIRLYGPNCPGLCNINRRLGMTFSPAFKNDLRKGPIGLATQGGGLGRNLMQAMERGAGFALWSSSGNEADLQVADFIHYMAGAEDIKVIVTLIEGIKDGPRFVSALAHAARCGKPVVGLKVGRSEYGAKAAQSHTASMTGSAEVNSTVFRQYGLIEVDDLDELVDVATLLARRLPNGREEVAVFASSGGAASLCADNVGTSGLKLASFVPQTTAALKSVLPEYAAIGNPVDTTSVTISNPTAFSEALLPVAEDPNVSLVFCPIAMDYGKYTDHTAELIIEVQAKTETPICPIWMSDRLGGGYQRLGAAGITPFRSLRNMGKAVQRWVDYGAWRSEADLQWRPLLLDTGTMSLATDTRTVTEVEAKTELARAGVPVAQAKLARSAAEAGVIADLLSTPVAMKVVSQQITHKSDVGGVQLNLHGRAVVEEVYQEIVAAVSKARPDAVIEGILVEPMAQAGGIELFVGVARDSVFGHVMTVGLGGIYVELFKDVARRMLPVSGAMARNMLEELRCAPLLRGLRGQGPRDLKALENFIVAVSDYVAANAGRVEELDLNPVWVGAEGQGAMALDAVLVVRT